MHDTEKLLLLIRIQDGDLDFTFEKDIDVTTSYFNRWTRMYRNYGDFSRNFHIEIFELWF